MKYLFKIINHDDNVLLATNTQCEKCVAMYNERYIHVIDSSQIKVIPSNSTLTPDTCEIMLTDKDIIAGVEKIICVPVDGNHDDMVKIMITGIKVCSWREMREQLSISTPIWNRLITILPVPEQKDYMSIHTTGRPDNNHYFVRVDGNSRLNIHKAIGYSTLTEILKHNGISYQFVRDWVEQLLLTNVYSFYLDYRRYGVEKFKTIRCTCAEDWRPYRLLKPVLMTGVFTSLDRPDFLSDEIVVLRNSGRFLSDEDPFPEYIILVFDSNYDVDSK